VEPAALAALLSGGAHGYDLRRGINEMTNGEIDVDPGGLYRVLRRMEEDGFVVSHWVEGDSGPQRRDYQLTQEGRELAEGWIAHLRERERLSGILADALAAALHGEKPRESEGDQ
jgi:DNA-binding PadR family transcriptional regulator